MSSLTFTTFDSFSGTPYAGNPCAVIQLPAPSHATLTQAQKQAIASEFNLSEVVFVHEPAADGRLQRSWRELWTLVIKNVASLATHHCPLDLMNALTRVRGIMVICIEIDFNYW